MTPDVHAISTAEGVSIRYRDYRPHGAVRATAMLVHGLASSGQQFEEDARYLGERGYRVLVPDLRGHGQSGVPPGLVRSADFILPVLAQDLLCVLDHAGASRVHWVGNSLGGILALFLLGTPNAARLRSLTLFGTCFALQLPRRVGSLVPLAFVPGKAMTAALTARLTTTSPIGRQAVAAAIRQLNVPAAAAVADAVRSYDFCDNALGFAGPLLVLRGGRDRLVNLGLGRQVARFAGRPGFTRIDLPQAGHCANLDMPAQFRAALEAHWMG